MKRPNMISGFLGTVCAKEDKYSGGIRGDKNKKIIKKNGVTCKFMGGSGLVISI
jgi:hypothetical protein